MSKEQETREQIQETFSKSNRVKIEGYYESNDGLCSGRGKGSRDFITAYDKAVKENAEKTENWVNKLKELGIVAAHPDDGWHDRKNHKFGLSYPYFKSEIKIGDMVALGDYKKFVVVIVTEISGFFSKEYHYKSSIF